MVRKMITDKYKDYDKITYKGLRNPEWNPSTLLLFQQFLQNNIFQI